MKPVLIAAVLFLCSGCAIADRPPLAAMSELSEKCQVPLDAVVYHYRAAQRHLQELKRRGATVRADKQLIFLGTGISDQRLLDRSNCIKEFTSRDGFRFAFHALSPTEI